MTPRDHRIGIALVAASTVAWSTSGLFTRMIALDAATMLVWRGLFGAMGLIATGLVLDGRRTITDWGRLGKSGWAYAAISGTGMLCFIGSLRLTTVAHVAIIYAAVPFIAATLAWVLLRDRPSRGAIVASAVALAGAVVMVGLGREGTLAGDLLALGMTVAMGLTMVLARRWPGIPTLPAAALSALLSAAACLPFASLSLPSPPQILLLVGFGLVNSALGLALFLLGSRRIAPIETALISALDAPLAPFWVWLFFAETPSLTTLAGATLVFGAVLGHMLHQSRALPPKGA